jgi:type I restriction enzyme M protein
LDDKRELLGKPDEDNPDLPSMRNYKLEENNIPDIIARFHEIASSPLEGDAEGSGASNDRTAQQFFVTADEIRAENYNLSFNLYQKIVHEQVNYTAPKVIIERISKMDEERKQLMNELGGLLG